MRDYTKHALKVKCLKCGLEYHTEKVKTLDGWWGGPCECPECNTLEAKTAARLYYLDYHDLVETEL